MTSSNGLSNVATSDGFTDEAPECVPTALFDVLDAAAQVRLSTRMLRVHTKPCICRSMITNTELNSFISSYSFWIKSSQI